MSDHDLDRLERLAALKSQGIITDEEFEQEKAKIKRQSAEVQPRPKPAPNKTKFGQPLWAPKKHISGKWLLMGFLLFVSFVALVASGTFDSPTPANEREPAPIFSAYDGACYPLESAIKSSMNDPDSYEHVETTHVVEESSIKVRTTFRGKNAFNATVLQRAEATLDKSGNIVSWNLEK